MKKPHKKMLILLLWVAVFVFAACGCSVTKNTPEESTPPIEKTITLSFSYGSKAFTKTVPYGGSVEVDAPPPVNGKVFAGWFSGQEKLTDSAQFTADKNYIAVFIERGDYKGIFRSEELMTVNLSETDGIAIDNAVYPEFQLLLNEHGELVLNYGGGIWKFFLLNGLFTGIHETARGTTSHTFKAVIRDTQYAGSYRSADGNSFVLSDYGTVLSCLGEVSGGVYTLTDGVLNLTFRRNSTDYAFTTLLFKSDGKGNFTSTFTGKTELYILSEGVRAFTAENGDTLTVFSRGEGYVYTLNRQSAQIVEAVGKPEVGKVLVLSGAVNTAVKLLEGNKFLYASVERGSYFSSVGETLILDGFGTATIRGYDWPYEVAGKNIISKLENGLPYYILLKDGGKYEHIDFSLLAFDGRFKGKNGEDDLLINVYAFTVSYRGVTVNYKIDPADRALTFSAFNAACTLKLEGKSLIVSYVLDSGEIVTEQYGTDGYEGNYLGFAAQLKLDGLGNANLDGEQLTYATDGNSIVFSNGIIGEFNENCLVLTMADDWILILNKL